MRNLPSLIAIPLALVHFAAGAQALTPNPSNTIYDFFISGPVTANLNGGATATGAASLSGSGYGASNAGSGPGWIVQTVPLTSLFFTGPGGINGAYAAPGVFHQQNVNPFQYPMNGGQSMSIGGVTLSGNFGLDVFGFTRNVGVSCIDCSSTFATAQGDIISFQFATGPVITALEVAAATGVPSPVPEPASLVLVAGGLGSLALKRRWRGAISG